ncbi:PPS-like protein [Mya arenaria]|uniref:PPS-like protein n=1 Tax=Mya arenaria TaxID=6604 RepID=A0ABY7D933_MYAAR|nr:PPS-like protein [Mya arenaria]
MMPGCVTPLTSSIFGRAVDRACSVVGSDFGGSQTMTNASKLTISNCGRLFINLTYTAHIYSNSVIYKKEALEMNLVGTTLEDHTLEIIESQGRVCGSFMKKLMNAVNFFSVSSHKIKIANGWLDKLKGYQVGERCKRSAELYKAITEQLPDYYEEIASCIVDCKLVKEFLEISESVILKSNAYLDIRTEGPSIEEAVNRLKSPVSWFGCFLLKKWIVKKARDAVGNREFGKSIAVELSDRFKQAYWRLADMLFMEIQVQEEEERKPTFTLKGKSQLCNKMKKIKGDVLIVSYTDVGWSPYFPLIAGLATELGGLVSHGAVVAREYGLPCVVNVPDATHAFHSGDYVHLDGTNGAIHSVIHRLEQLNH